MAEGAWWSILWSPSAAAHRVHRLDNGTGAWVDTGPTLATEQQRAFDVLAEGATLLVASNAPTVPATAVDPVCQMSVPIAAARQQAEVDGVTYYFCCAGCRTKFLNDPQAYLAHP